LYYTEVSDLSKFLGGGENNWKRTGCTLRIIF